MSNNSIEKNAETIKHWLKHINFDAEHPGYANDIYDKLDQIVKESNKFNEVKPLAQEVRIYYSSNLICADIKYITDKDHIFTIDWNNIEERNKFIYNGYTLYYDERIA